jgi:hypothetical protein
MRCKLCFHFAKPGLSDGYCAGRTDQPKAYGENHPLHKLPPDKGEKCEQFKPRER